MSNPIYVTRLEDDETLEGTLRYAVKQVNYGGGYYDSIIIDPSLSGQTIELQSSLGICCPAVIEGTNVTITGNKLYFSADITLRGLNLNFQNLEEGVRISESITVDLDDCFYSAARNSDGNIYGISTPYSRTVDIHLNSHSSITIINHAIGDASGISRPRTTNDSVTLTDVPGFFIVTATNGNANGIAVLTSAALENVSGDFTITAASSATGVSSSSVTIGNITGNFTVTATGGSANGIAASTVAAVGDVTGSFAVTATGGSAIGIYSHASEANSSVTLGDVTGSFTVTATDDSATGVSSSVYDPGSSMSFSSIEIADVTETGSIAVKAMNGNAKGIVTSTSWKISSSATLGKLAGILTVTATGGDANGIYAFAYDSHFYGYSSSSITMDYFEGTFAVTATGGSAAGIYSITW